ncbi:hypothetical protein H6501_01700 [Candidatus Woesearchaeota archaeon]|nr:hypothetical protein [Nanoarchaeota archaeon]MCB9370290.1 hypothetical protein [Candidatus Woesearchaeota archaeon]USN44814.1 MAG: hypothetical protein H6500_03145 [Candidatus Woesearchaeota archaeon]
MGINDVSGPTALLLIGLSFAVSYSGTGYVVRICKALSSGEHRQIEAPATTRAGGLEISLGDNCRMSIENGHPYIIQGDKANCPPPPLSYKN